MQSQTQGEQIRVTAKKRDDLQAVIAAVQGARLRHPAAVRQLPATDDRAARRRDLRPVGRRRAQTQALRAQAGDAVRRRRVRREQVRHGPAAQRVDDVGRRLGRVDVRRDALGTGLELLERPGQRLAGAQQPGGRRVRLVLAAAADRRLDQRRGDRAPGSASAAPTNGLLSPSSERPPPPKISAQRAMRGDERDAHGDRRGDRADEDVAVAHVGELVGEHALDLVPGQRAAAGPR